MITSPALALYDLSKEISFEIYLSIQEFICCEVLFSTLTEYDGRRKSFLCMVLLQSLSLVDAAYFFWSSVSANDSCVLQTLKHQRY